MKENTKDFNKMMNNNKDMPKVITLTDKVSIERYGGSKMIIVPPIAYDVIMKKIPKGKLITTKEIREYIAKINNCNLTDTMTSGIFINICAWASYQRDNDITPYWRTLKSDGELNPKYPEACELQKKKLEEEGFIIESKGKKNVKYYVVDYDKYIFDLK